MNRADLVAKAAEEADVSRACAARVLDSLLEQVTDALAEGDSVTLSGFGTFSIRARAARQARNPGTGEPVAVPPSRGVAFKAGKGLKDAVN